MRVQDLLEALPLPYAPEPLPDDATDAEILEAEREPLDFAEGVLKRCGVRTRPAPGDVGANGVVVLRPSNRYAVQGAIATGLFALIVGGASSKIAFVGFAPFVAAGIWIAWRHTAWIERRVPAKVPRGYAFGAGLMVVLLVISTALAVQPTRLWVRHRGEQRNAIANAHRSEELLRAGRVGEAYAYAEAAMSNSSESPEARTAYVHAREAVAAQIDAAARSQESGLWDRAQAQLEVLDGCCGAPATMHRYASDNADILVARARSELDAGRARKAFDAYNLALKWNPDVADPQLMLEIARALGISDT